MHLAFRAIPFRPAAPCALMLFLVLAGPALAQEAAPRVVDMVPANGAADVDPALKQLVVTFSEPMKDRSWSVIKAGGVFPDVSRVFYREGFEVFVMDVALKPGTTYVFGLNGPSHKGFKNMAGVPLEPVPVTFTTSGENEANDAAGAAGTEAPGKAKVAFDLVDANGVRVRSQDYAGVPIFLSFGAAW